MYSHFEKRHRRDHVVTALFTLTLLIVPAVLPGPLIAGHRGAGADEAGGAYAENTLPSIAAAFDAGADLVEVDVQLDARGEVILWHDAVVRLPGDRFVAIRDVTRDQLARCAGCGAATEQATTLEDALLVALARQNCCLAMDIELKVYHACDRGLLLRRVLSVVDRHNAGRRVLMTSSDLPILRMLKKARPEIEAGLIAPLPAVDWRFFVAELERGVQIDWFLPRRNLRAWAMYPEELAREAHRRGVKVGVWTVNEPRQIEVFVAAGYDMIITDDAATAHHLIRGAYSAASEPLVEVLLEARLIPHVLLPF